jgi:putative effector of murein hydrolase
LQVDPVAGAFSGLAMGLNALATAILLPLLWHLFF